MKDDKNQKITYKPLIFDITFKYIFGYEKNIRFTEYLIEILLKQEPGYFKGKLKIINSYNIDKKHIYEKGKELDVNVLLPDNTIINLEAYSSYFIENSKRKSLMYESASYSIQLNSGKKINNINVKKVKQFNFVQGYYLPYQEYGLVGLNEPYDEFIPDEFQLIVFNIDEYETINYNNDIRLNELLEYMDAKTHEEALKIRKKYNRKEINEMDVELQNFQDINAWMNEAFSKGRWFDAILADNVKKAKEDGYASGVNDGYNSGKNEGRNEAVLETAKNFLKLGVDIKTIKEATGLSIKKIKNLKSKN